MGAFQANYHPLAAVLFLYTREFLNIDEEITWQIEVMKKDQSHPSPYILDICFKKQKTIKQGKTHIAHKVPSDLKFSNIC